MMFPKKILEKLTATVTATIIIVVCSDIIGSALSIFHTPIDKDHSLQIQLRPTLSYLGSFFHVQNPTHVKRAFLKYKLIPDVLEEAPECVLRVHYSVRRGLVAKFGNVLNPTELDRRPNFLRWPTTENAYYTLFMIDPDACPYPNTSWLNWYVVNIFENKLVTGFDIAKYIPLRPKKGSGLHRIVFLVYQQPLGEYFFYDEMFHNDTRVNFTLTRILKKYNYDRPVAGNFFQVQWMKPVPTKRPKSTTTPEKN